MNDYPAEAIQAQHAFWDAGSPTSGPLFDEAQRWRREVSRHLREFQRPYEEAKLVGAAWKIWKEARRRAGKAY